MIDLSKLEERVILAAVSTSETDQAESSLDELKELADTAGAKTVGRVIQNQRELSQIIRSEIKDPRIHPLTSVVAVEVTPDLKYCKAYISVLGDEEAGKATIEGLRSAASFVRRELAHRVNLRNTPEIKFILDQSIEYGVTMSKLIDEVTKDLHDNEEEGLE